MLLQKVIIFVQFIIIHLDEERSDCVLRCGLILSLCYPIRNRQKKNAANDYKESFHSYKMLMLLTVVAQFVDMRNVLLLEVNQKF